MGCGALMFFIAGVVVTTLVSMLGLVIRIPRSTPCTTRLKVKQIMKKIDKELVGLRDFSCFFIDVQDYLSLNGEKQERLQRYYDEKRVTVIPVSDNRLLVILFPPIGVNTDTDFAVTRRLIFLSSIKEVNRKSTHSVPGNITLSAGTREELLKDHGILVRKVRGFKGNEPSNEGVTRTDIEFFK